MNTRKKTAKGIACIFKLSGSVEARKTVALRFAKSAGMTEPAAVKLVEKLARKERVQ